jgi:hypothetical protein
VERAFMKLGQGATEIDIEDIKRQYNAKRHPDVLQGKRTEQTVLVEFVETLEASHAINNPDEDFITLDEWLEYYTDIGSPIEDDQTFIQMVKNTWNLKEEPTKAQTPQVKPPAMTPANNTQQDFRPGHGQQKVQRSGMQSNDNPLYNTKQFYGEKTTAMRGNTAGGMFKDSGSAVGASQGFKFPSE